MYLEPSELTEFKRENFGTILNGYRDRSDLCPDYKFLIKAHEGTIEDWDTDFSLEEVIKILDVHCASSNSMFKVFDKYYEKKRRSTDPFEFLSLILLHTEEGILELTKDVINLVLKVITHVRIHNDRFEVCSDIFYSIIRNFINKYGLNEIDQKYDFIIPECIPLEAFLVKGMLDKEREIKILSMYLKRFNLESYFMGFLSYYINFDGQDSKSYILEIIDRAFLNVIEEGYISNYIYFLQTFPEYANIKNDSFKKLCDSQNLISNINPDGLRNIYKSIKDTDSKFEFEISMLLYNKIYFESEKYYEGNSYREFIIRVATSLRDKGNKLIEFENVNPFKGSKYLEGIIKGNLDEKAPFMSSLTKINENKPLHNNTMECISNIVKDFLLIECELSEVNKDIVTNMIKIFEREDIKKIIDQYYSIGGFDAGNDFESSSFSECVRILDSASYKNNENLFKYDFLLDSFRYYDRWALYFNFVQNGNICSDVDSFEGVTNFPLFFYAHVSSKCVKIKTFGQIYEIVNQYNAGLNAIFRLNLKYIRVYLDSIYSYELKLENLDGYVRKIDSDISAKGVNVKNIYKSIIQLIGKEIYLQASFVGVRGEEVNKLEEELNSLKSESDEFNEKLKNIIDYKSDQSNDHDEVNINVNLESTINFENIFNGIVRNENFIYLYLCHITEALFVNKTKLREYLDKYVEDSPEEVAQALKSAYKCEYVKKKVGDSSRKTHIRMLFDSLLEKLGSEPSENNVMDKFKKVFSIFKSPDNNDRVDQNIEDRKELILWLKKNKPM